LKSGKSLFVNRIIDELQWHKIYRRTAKIFIMKKNLTSLLLIGALFVWSCNNDAGNTTSADSTITSNNAATGTNDTANNTGNNNANTGAPLNEMDQQFVKKSASSGMMEVEAGNLAQQNASNQRVKDFAAMMVRDHTTANQELMSFASGRGLMLSDSLMPEHRKHVDAMRNMKGKSFDQHYMSMMTDAHQKDVAEFEKASQNVNDADLKNWATKTLPTLRMHLDSAKAIKAKM